MLFILQFINRFNKNNFKKPIDILACESYTKRVVSNKDMKEGILK